jgi:hypothetical protein
MTASGSLQIFNTFLFKPWSMKKDPSSSALVLSYMYYTFVDSCNSITVFRLGGFLCDEKWVHLIVLGYLYTQVI